MASTAGGSTWAACGAFKFQAAPASFFPWLCPAVSVSREG